MRRPITLICVTVAALVGGWIHAPAAGAAAENCSGDVVVAIDAELRARPGLDTVTVPLAAALAPGEYRVTAHSSDRRPVPTARIQELEQWTLALVGVSGPVATLGPTSDLDDLTEHPSMVDDLGRVVLTEEIISLTVRHVISEGGGNSVRAECVGFTEVVDPGSPPVPDGDGDGDEPDPTPAPGEDDPPGSADPPGGPAPGGSDPGAGSALISSEAVVDCATGTLGVSIANRGSVGAEVDIAVPRTAVARALPVGPGETSTTTIPLGPDAENRDLVVRVLDSRTGVEITTSAIGVDCLARSAVTASLVLDCSIGDVLVDLVNRGGEATELTILSERGSVEVIQLAAGSTERVEIAVGDRDEIAVLVVGPDRVPLVDRRIDVDCPRPELSAESHVDCAAGEVVVEASNAGDRRGTATIRFSDRLLEVSVAARSRASVSTPLAALADEPTVSVSADGRSIHSAEIDENCVEPLADVDVDCRTVSLGLVNDGDGTADFGVELLVGGVAALAPRVSVPSGRVVLELPAVDREWLIRVTEASRTGFVEEFSGAVDCRRPWAELAVDCSSGTVEVRAGVEGREPGRLAVLADDVVIARLTVAADSTIERSFEFDSEVESLAIFADSAADPVAEQIPACGGDDPGGGLRVTGALVAVLVGISWAASVRWKAS